MVLKIFFLLTILSLFLSCSRKIYPVSNSDNLAVFPAPPDSTRIQFLTRISSSKDVTGSRKSFAKSMLGVGSGVFINKPYGVAVHDGKIMICDAIIHGLVIIDLERNKFEQFVPKGKGALKIPHKLFCRFQRLFICSRFRKEADRHF